MLHLLDAFCILAAICSIILFLVRGTVIEYHIDEGCGGFIHADSGSDSGLARRFAYTICDSGFICVELRICDADRLPNEFASNERGAVSLRRLCPSWLTINFCLLGLLQRFELCLLLHLSRWFALRLSTARSVAMRCV